MTANSQISVRELITQATRFIILRVVGQQLYYY